MQTAVECNGSNSTFTTTTTTASNSNIIDNSHQPQPQQPESILLNRLLVGKINNNNASNTNCSSSSSSSSAILNSQPTNQLQRESSVKAIAAQYEEFILGSPSKGGAASRPKLLASNISNNTGNSSASPVSKVIPQSQPMTAGAAAGTAVTTPTSNSSYHSCNSSEASTPTGTTTSSRTQNTPRSGYAAKNALASAAADSSYDELLQWKDMPKYLQFNPYVLKGYRPLQTFKGCLLSLFYWHNETINILTHAIPIVYILAIVPGLMPWEKGYRFLSFCHVFGSVAPWCGSFVYHLFMNIEKGENVYYRLLKLDMVGIWVSQSFGALPLVTATTFCFTHKWKWFIILSYCMLSLWGLYKALTASSPWQRRLCFAMPFTMRSVLTLLRTMGVVGGNRIALSHVYLQDGVSILGGAIGAMRIPEKWFPGLVDFYLNSHNIMHVLVVVAVYSMHQATVKDIEWMSQTQCNSMNASNETIESAINSNIEL